MADLTPEQLAEIRARVDGATAAPWTVDDVCVVTPDRIQIADFEWLADTAAEWDEFKRNAAFVAAAREDVPALLAEVERLRADLAAAREQREITRAEREGWRTSYERLSRQLLRRHWAWQSAKRGRREARAELTEYRASNRQLRDLAQQALDDKNTARADFMNMRSTADRLRAERDRLAEQVQTLRALAEDAQHLRMHGERAPGGNETWQAWDRKARTTLRTLDGTGGGQ